MALCVFFRSDAIPYVGTSVDAKMAQNCENKKPSCRYDRRPYWLSMTFKVIQGQ